MKITTACARARFVFYYIVMLFSELLSAAGLEARRRGEAEVTSVVCDSRLCRDGSCFVAVRGAEDDGHRYVAAATDAGASAVVYTDASAAPRGVASAQVEDSRAAAGPLAQAMLAGPGQKLTCVGITGTNGKTTVAHLVHSVLSQAGYRPGILGTITYRTGVRELPAGVTTPDPVALAEMTGEMVSAGMTHLVMEVSSHALDQRRTAGIEFDAAVFTNLSGDHLDYHKTMDAYAAAKRRLFERGSLRAGGTAVINRDDPRGESFARATEGEVIWYGLSPAADVHGKIRSIDSSGSRFCVMHGGAGEEVATPLIGRHNVYNCLAVSAACLSLGIDLRTVAGGLASVKRVQGRLEPVDPGAPYGVFVDYAHTDDALQNVLGSLQPLTSGRLIVVFGCGGDRDRTKRPRMARIAERFADRIVITSDNPRTERPDEIIDQILAGLSEPGRAKTDVCPDRRRAIERAVAQAEAGDVVLIAGKGHETYQVVGTEKIPFDDVSVARGAMHTRGKPHRRGMREGCR